MIERSKDIGGVAHLRVRSSRLSGRCFSTFRSEVSNLRRDGLQAILLDISELKKLRPSDQLILVEMAALAQPDMHFATCGAKDHIKLALKDSGVDQAVRVFSDQVDAFSWPPVRRAQMAGTPAFILCSDAGQRMGPLTADRPKALLDLMGRPIVEHLLRNLARHGITQVTLNPGHGGAKLVHGLRDLPRNVVAPSFLNEGGWRRDGWQAQVCSTTETLVRAAQQANAFQTPTLIVRGDCVADVDWPLLISDHLACHADITIAQTNGGVAKPAGLTLTELETAVDVPDVCIIGPGAIPKLHALSEIAKPQNFLALMRANGADIRWSAARAKTFAVRTQNAYFTAWRHALKGRLWGLVPHAEEVSSGVWLAKNASLPRGAKIDGALFVGDSASVGPESRLIGTNVVLSGAQLNGGFMQNSLLAEDVNAGAKAWVQDMIAGGDWAVHHLSATDVPDVTQALSDVTKSEPETWALRLAKVG